MLFSKRPVVPVSCPRNLLWLCPVSHAVFLTIAQRHWRGGQKEEGRRVERGGEGGREEVRCKFAVELLNWVQRTWIRSCTNSNLDQ